MSACSEFDHRQFRDSVPFSLCFVNVSRIPFFSDPGPRNDQRPAGNLFPNKDTSVALALHSRSFSADPHMMSLNIDMKIIRPFFGHELYGLRTFLWSIGLVNYVGHPQPPQSYWARVYCGCQPGPTRVALHPGRMMEKPERQPYIHWTTCYDFEEMRNIELCSYTPPRPVRVYDLVDPGSTTSSSTVLSAA